MGFREVGLRKGYYQDTHADALLLTIFGIQDSFIWNDISKRRNDVARQIRVKYGPTPAEIREIEAGYMTDELARNKSTDT